MWRVASLLNTSGSVTYWLFGRRSVPELRLVETEVDAA